MKIDQELPVLMSGEKVYHLLVGEVDDYQHSFGGPGLSLDPSLKNETLRHVFSLDISDPRLGFGETASGLLPLYYGFESSGDIEYAYSKDDGLTILSMSDEGPEPDWPYPDYPRDFPVAPLKLVEVDYGDLQEVIHSYAFFADLDYREEEEFNPMKYCYVIAVPRDEFGVSLWGEDGDAEMVEVGFSIDLKTKIVKGTQAFS